jgi:putative heme-binding domain-containing protein
LTREQLLEALINPSARIAPGYGMVTLKMKNGNTVSGILKDESADTLLQVSDIAQRTNAASSMPPMRSLLTKKEIRDIVSFLVTLKEEE